MNYKYKKISLMFIGIFTSCILLALYINILIFLNDKMIFKNIDNTVWNIDILNVFLIAFIVSYVFTNVEFYLIKTLYKQYHPS